jgi:hypothetical protein
MAGTWAKRAPLLGIVAVAFIVAAFVVGGETPDADASAAKVLDFYNDNDSSQIIAALLLGYGAVFLVLFAAVLRSTMRPGEGGSGAVSALIPAGAVILAIGMLLFAGITFTLGDLADKLDPSAAQALNALNGDLFLPLAAGVWLFNLATGISILRTGALPRWLGWAIIVVGIVGMTPGGFFAFLLTGVWILIASVLLYRSSPDRSSPATA